MDAYDNYGACGKLHGFVDALSNWYVRRSRERFWSKGESADKLDAYWTLYECLTTVAKLIAPFTPFLAEHLWRNLAGVFGSRAVESVHLCDYPIGERSEIDEQLSERMDLLRNIASLGRAARMSVKMRVRQPLAKVEVVLASDRHQAWLEEHDALVRDELNVKQVEYSTRGEQYITYEVRPNFKLLGPRLGKLLPKVKETLARSDGARMLEEMTAQGKVTLSLEGQSVELSPEELEVRLHAKEGWTAAQGPGCVVVLSTDITPELEREGLARDLVRFIQDRRKELGCELSDTIEVGVATDSAKVRQAIEENRDYLQGETQAARLVLEPLSGVEPIEVKLGGESVQLYVRRV
jgi:isoleucyl-tRNA synthetase